MLAAGVRAQTGPPRLDSGKEIYRAACAACHGVDGRGASRQSVGFLSRLPDFTVCNFASRENDVDWAAIVRNGGPARGFSTIMPAFGAALAPVQIEAVVEYLHTFCTSRVWPRGNLNLPRAMVTEKAFPEDEVVITTAVNAHGTPGVAQELVYERRIGARNQIELFAPLNFTRARPGVWFGGIGDAGIGLKRTLLQSNRTGSIFSVAGEAIFPTGNRDRGFGTGTMVFETYAAYGQILPHSNFLHLQSGFEAPTHTDKAPRAAYWRGTLGHTFSQGGGFGRNWSPMVELLADRDLHSGARTNWDVLPQFQVTLSRRQHIMANFGVRVPATNTAGRPVQLMFYLLWDWFDGGLKEGW